MRNRQLHAALSAFAEEAAWQLQSDTSEGADLPSTSSRGGAARQPALLLPPAHRQLHLRAREPARPAAELPARARRAARLGGLEVYLESRGEPAPRDSRERAESALRTFLGRVFEDSTDFILEDSRLKRALHEIEAAIYDNRAETVVIAPLLGLEIASSDLPLGDGLSLVRGDAFGEEAPGEAVWAPGADRPHLLAVLRWEAAAGDAAPVAHARVRLRRLLTALRLFEAGSFAFGPLAWTRTGGGTWQPFALGTIGHRTDASLHRHARAGGRAARVLQPHLPPHPARGEIAWALRRFEMGCDRAVPAEALSDTCSRCARCSSRRARRGAARRPARRALRARGARPVSTGAIARIARLERPVIGGLARRARRSTCSSASCPATSARCCATSCAATSTPTCAGSRTRCSPRPSATRCAPADAEQEAELEARAQLRAAADAKARAEHEANGDAPTEGYDPGFVRFAEP